MSSSPSASPAPAPARRQGARRALAFAAGGAGLLAAAVYLARFMAIAPWDPDAGLLLGYVDQVAHGERAYFDFLDAYGPLAWPLPAHFYGAFGDRVLGVRVLILLLKLGSVFLGFQLVRRLAGGFHALLAALWMTILLGMPWPYLQMPYSFHQALPLLLLTWLLLLVRPIPRAGWNVFAAGVTTLLVVWLKLNTGLFLLAAGLLYGFGWSVARASPGRDGDGRDRWQRSFGAAQGLGLVGYALVFGTFLAKHVDRYFLVYLALPLGLALWAAAARVAESRRAGEPIAAPLRAGSLLLASFVGLSAVFGLGYFGVGSVLDYVREQARLLSSLSYAVPLPALGAPGTRVGFNEWYWLQLPWLVTASYVAWWLAAGRRAPLATRSALHGLFAFVALGSFVLYPRADEPHVLQAIVPAVPALFVYLAHLETAVPTAWRIPLRGVLAVLAVAYGSTLIFGPDAGALEPRGWSQASMKPIRYQPDPHLRSAVAPETLRRMDEAVDRAARHLDSISEDGSVVWNLTRHELLNFLSHTRPAGGRYKYVFYLAKTRLIGRAAFEALVPEALRLGLLANPPGVVVTGVSGKPILMDVMPELEPLLATRYRAGPRFGGLQLLVRID